MMIKKNLFNKKLKKIIKEKKKKKKNGRASKWKDMLS